MLLVEAVHISVFWPGKMTGICTLQQHTDTLGSARSGRVPAVCFYLLLQWSVKVNDEPAPLVCMFSFGWLTFLFLCALSFPAPQMFDWIMHNKGLFLAGYTEIGNNHPHAVELQTQHNHFAMNCMVRHTYIHPNADPQQEPVLFRPLGLSSPCPTLYNHIVIALRFNL